MAKKSPTPAKPAQPKFSIKGPFVLATFLRVCRAMEIMEADAHVLFAALQNRGEIIEAGGIGINGETKSFIYKTQ